MRIQSLRKLFADVWDAIRGHEHDYTQIRLGKAILLLSIPMVLEMMMESLFAIVDIYYVSQLGDEAVAVVGITESLMTLVYSIGVGFAMATTGLVARRIGERHDADATIASAQAILLGIMASVLFAVPGILYSAKIFALMRAEPEVIEMGTGYMSIMLGSNVLIMLLFINNAIFRSAGAPALALRVLLVANGLNIILDPCFIFGWGPFPEMGVTGAAVATTIGRSIGVAYQFWLLFSASSRIRLKLKSFKLQLSVIWKLLFLSGGGIGQYLIATSSWIFLYRILAEYKSEVLAGYTIAIRVFIFFLLPTWGLSNAASTLVGQNLGAGNPRRAERSVWATAWVNSIYMVILTILFFFFPQWFIGMFIPEGAAFDLAVSCLRIIGYGMFFYGFSMILSQAFNGAGDTYTPTLLNFIGFWLLEIPLAYILSKYTPMAETGVFYAIFIAESLVALMAIFFFLRGKWKLKMV